MLWENFFIGKGDYTLTKNFFEANEKVDKVICFPLNCLGLYQTFSDDDNSKRFQKDSSLDISRLIRKLKRLIQLLNL